MNIAYDDKLYKSDAFKLMSDNNKDFDFKNVSDDLAYNFSNELFDYCKANSKMLWTRDDYVVFRLKELFRNENMDVIKKLILCGSKDIETDEPGLDIYINLCKDIIEINREIMAFYDEEVNTLDYYLFKLIDDLCEKYGKLHQINLESQTT